MRFIVCTKAKKIRHVNSGIELNVLQDYKEDQIEVKFTSEGLTKVPPSWWGEGRENIIPHFLMRASEAYSKALQMEKQAKKKGEKLTFFPTPVTT